MNNTNYTEEQLREAYDKAPEDVKGLIIDENLGFLMQAIGRENGITPEQSLDIEYEVIRTLLGLHEVEDLAKNIKDSVLGDISGETAWKIARDIKADVFAGIKGVEQDNTEPNQTEKKEAEVSETPKAPKPVPKPPSNLPTAPEKKEDDEKTKTEPSANYRAGMDNSSSLEQTSMSEERRSAQSASPIEQSGSITDIPAPGKEWGSFEEKLKAIQDRNGEPPNPPKKEDDNEEKNKNITQSKNSGDPYREAIE